MSLRESSIAVGRAPLRQRVGWVVGGAAFMLVPWVTLGLGTAIAFLTLAVLYRHLGREASIILWASVAVYTTALIVMLATADDSPGALFIASALVSIVVAGVQSGVLVVAAALQGHRPRLYRSTPAHGRFRVVGAFAEAPGSHSTERKGHDLRMNAPSRTALALFYGVLAIALTYVLVDDVQFTRRHLSAPATVLSLKKLTTCTSSGSCYDEYRPTVAFVTAAGRPMRIATASTVLPDDRSTYAVGRSVTVFYDRDHPEDVRLEAGLGFADALAVAWYLLGVWMLVRTLRRRRARHPAVAGPAEGAVLKIVEPKLLRRRRYGGPAPAGPRTATYAAPAAPSPPPHPDPPDSSQTSTAPPAPPE